MPEMFKFIDYIINNQYVDVAPSYSRMQKVLLVELVMFTKLLCVLFGGESPAAGREEKPLPSPVASKSCLKLYTDEEGFRLNW